jgi:hypothetical protein
MPGEIAHMQRIRGSVHINNDLSKQNEPAFVGGPPVFLD